MAVTGSLRIRSGRLFQQDHATFSQHGEGPLSLYWSLWWGECSVSIRCPMNSMISHFDPMVGRGIGDCPQNLPAKN